VTGRANGTTGAATTGGRALPGRLSRVTGGLARRGGHPARAARPVATAGHRATTGTATAGTAMTGAGATATGTTVPPAGTVPSAETARSGTTRHPATSGQGGMSGRPAPRGRRLAGVPRRAGRSSGRAPGVPTGRRRAGTPADHPGVRDIPRAGAPQATAGTPDRADISDICSQAAALRAGLTFPSANADPLRWMR
jgi:hypothetical protein